MLSALKKSYSVTWIIFSEYPWVHYYHNEKEINLKTEQNILFVFVQPVLDRTCSLTKFEKLH